MKKKSVSDETSIPYELSLSVLSVFSSPEGGRQLIVLGLLCLIMYYSPTFYLRWIFATRYLIRETCRLGLEKFFYHNYISKITDHSEMQCTFSTCKFLYNSVNCYDGQGHSKNTRRNIKLKFFKIITASSLIYGSECWTLTSKQ